MSVIKLIRSLLKKPIVEASQLLVDWPQEGSMHFIDVTQTSQEFARFRRFPEDFKIYEFGSNWAEQESDAIPLAHEVIKQLCENRVVLTDIESTPEVFKKKKYTREEAEILDVLLMIHAEHGGGNNSTFTTRVVSSSDTDTYSAIAAAVGSLKGSRHGGANIRVVEMMDELKANVKDWSSEKEVSDYLYKIARKEAYDKSGLIYGMGHAIYTISDPREILLKAKAKELAKEKGCMEEFELYNMIERLAPSIIQDVHNSDKKVCANVDFYSGFVYTMLNIPRELFTPIFAISRIAGWSAHRIEEIVSGGRIYRPAYKNVSPERDFVPLANRK